MSGTPLADALRRVPTTTSVEHLWRVLRDAAELLHDGDRPEVDRPRAGEVMDEFVAMIANAPQGAAEDRGLAPFWQWNMGATLSVLQRLRENAPAALMELLGTIRANVYTHNWYMMNNGTDLFEHLRWPAVEVMAQAAVVTEPERWEQALIERGSERDAIPSAASLIRLRRTTVGQTQRGLAEAVGVSRDTVVSWEQDRHQPSQRHAEALARALGGDTSDYLANPT